MDWSRAIERNRVALLRIVAVLFVYAGLDEGGADVLPRRAWRKILVVLRPAESAVRRLIVIAARNIDIESPKLRPAKPPTGLERPKAAGVLVFHEINLGLACAPWRAPAAAPEKPEPRVPAFPLVDPPRRFDKRAWDGERPFPRDGFVLADEDEEVKAARLCGRLRALKGALDDIDGQARRLARRRARARLAPGGRAAYFVPIRRGHPPGYRRRLAHPVADLLGECHGLARDAMKAPDTS